MLLLSRKVGEVIHIGNSISIKIVDSKGDGVTLGIDAPKNIPIHRKEVFDAIVEQNKQAAKINVAKFKENLVDDMFGKNQIQPIMKNKDKSK